MAAMRSSEALVAPRRQRPISAWAIRHVSTAIAALGRLSRQPFSSLMTVLVIGVTLALPAAMHLVIKNAQVISASWDNALDFSVYLHTDVTLADAQRLADIVSQRADVENVTLIAADDALAEFREQSGFGEALDRGLQPPPHRSCRSRPLADQPVFRNL